MKNIKNFFIEIGKSLLVFILYLGLSIFLGTLFTKILNDNNFWIANLSGIAIELIILLILFLIYHKKIINDFISFKRDYKSIMNIAFKNWVLGLVIMFISNILISTIVGNLANNEELNRTLLLTTPLYAITAMIFIAPITEEIIFRISPRKAFKRKIPYLIFSAIFFGSMHLLASETLIEILYIIPYGALGFFFAKSYYETDNIFSSISTHMIHNTIAVILAYVALMG